PTSAVHHLRSTLIAFIRRHRYLPDLHSFPTRRSSDLRIDELYHRGGVRIDHQLVLVLRVFQVTIRRIGRNILAVAPFVIEYLPEDRKSTRLNSSHVSISYAVFCLRKKTKRHNDIAYLN